MTKTKKKQTKQSKTHLVEEILNRGDKSEIRHLFGFDSSHSDEEVLFKFRLWSRWFFQNYFSDEKGKSTPDAPFHVEIDKNNLRVYRGKSEYYVNATFRGAAKTTRTKLFTAFVIANDFDHLRRYIKVLSKDGSNSRQFVTDTYNLFIQKKVAYFYPDIFTKTEEKRREAMSEFDTATGIKMRAGTVGQEQRGQVADDSRPDFVIFDDFETREVLRSAVKIQAIWDNMEEARTGLSRTGGAIYLCNYLSERGNVHKLIAKYKTTIIPIKGKVELRTVSGAVDARHVDGKPTWPQAYTEEDVEDILSKADDPAGEYLSCPAVGEDVYFPRDMLDKQDRKKPIDTIAGFKIFHEYDPSHRYGSGHDVAGGVGLDHSTSVFIDFTQNPAQVVGTFKSNTLKPDVFGDEINSQRKNFGTPIIAVENNKFDMCIGRLKQLCPELLYTMKEKETRAGQPTKVRQWGWNTNSLTKSTMLIALRKAIKDGLLELSDPDLIAEARSYTRDDVMDNELDPRLATRHFDLLIACAIAWQMKDLAEPVQQFAYEQPAYEPSSEYESAGEIVKQSMLGNNLQTDYEQPEYESVSSYEG